MRVFVMLDGYTHYGEGFEFVKVEDLREWLKERKGKHPQIILETLITELEEAGK